MKKYICFLIFLASITVFGQSKDEIRIIIVRHAEKMTDNPKEKDPELTTKGNERAVDLATRLHESGKIDVAYTTDYRRTRNTAQPTATSNKITLQIYDASKLQEFAKNVLKKDFSKTVLIVGHSNTVLETIEALGGKRPIDSIGDQEYDNAFLMLIKADGSIKTEVFKYGAPSSNTEGPQIIH
ncbi:broad specificity phosphatase PhoE [Flavobacterium sp. 7E]|uniref:SixA phosphatase family protein n=1 Tax=Flavobacterium sp. 7E TaxID=2735898 RepID=UPI00156DBD16|nr:histidine phosphatase family protein [Flavobacterium sp. 7E]NRS89948.1 broad specificity phosphatase PhoE [Flavobacterium sp. 7E]